MKDLEFFYISEDELMRRSYEPRYRGKPLAWIFYEMYLELPEKSFLSKFQNFCNRFSIEYGVFEIFLSDNSIFVMGNGKIQIFHPASGFSGSFAME